MNLTEGSARDAIRQATSRNNVPNGALRSKEKLIAERNRMRLIDSKLSLDRRHRARDSGGMIAQPYELYIERRDPTRNMARYYVLSIQATLFGDVQLTRRWGRIGARGQAMSHSFAREDDAVRLFLDVLRLKRKRGYGPKGRVAMVSRR